MTPEEIKAMDEAYGYSAVAPQGGAQMQGDSPAGGDVSPAEAARAKYSGGIKGWLFDNIIGPLGGQLVIDTAEQAVGQANTAAYGAIDAITLGGASYIPGYQENRDFWKESHPYAYTGGNVAGSVAGAGKAKGLYTAGKEAMETAAPLVKQGLETAEGMIGRNMVTRATGSAAAAGTVGGVTAFNEGEFTPGGAAIGAAVAGALHIPSEYAGRGLSRLAGTGAGQAVIDKVANMLDRTPNMQGYDAASLQATRRMMGDEATLADIDPTIREFANNLMRDPKNYDDSLPLTQLMGRRLTNLQDPSSTIREQFAANTEALMQPFYNMNVSLGRARTIDEVTREVRDNQKSLSKLYTATLDKYSNWSAKPDQLKDLVDLSLRGGDPTKPLSAGGVDAAAFISKRIDELSKDANDRMRPVDMQQLRLDLGPQIKAYIKAGDGDNARRLIGVKQMLEDDFLNKLPGYTDLNKAYATEEGYLTGYELGSKFFKMKPDDYDSFSLQMAALSPADQKGMFEGMARSLYTSLDEVSTSNAMLNKLSKKDSIYRGLETVMGPKVATAFIEEAKKAITLQETANKLTNLAGSAKQQARAAIEGQKHGVDVATVASGAARAAGQVLNIAVPGASVVNTFGTAQRIANNPSLPSKERAFANNLLQQQGAGLDPYLQDIAAGKLDPSRDPAKESLIKMMQDQLGLNPSVASTVGGAAAAQQGNVSPADIRDRRNEGYQ